MKLYRSKRVDCKDSSKTGYGYDLVGDHKKSGSIYTGNFEGVLYKACLLDGVDYEEMPMDSEIMIKMLEFIDTFPEKYPNNIQINDDLQKIKIEITDFLESNQPINEKN